MFSAADRGRPSPATGVAVVEPSATKRRTRRSGRLRLLVGGYQGLAAKAFARHLWSRAGDS
jgi:hypothetical protein